MKPSTIFEQRKEDFSSFQQQNVFPDGCDSWEDFLNFCRPHKGEPFTLHLERCFGEKCKTIESYYFFGVIYIDDAGSLGERCFTPIDFLSHTERFYQSLKKEDIGIGQDASHQYKIKSISFDQKVFERNLIARSLSQVDKIIQHSSNYSLAAKTLGYLGAVRASFPRLSLKDFDGEMGKIKSKLDKR